MGQYKSIKLNLIDLYCPIAYLLRPPKMNKKKATQHISVYRFEFLLFGLLMLLFDKIFFVDNVFYLSYVWPANMLILGVASVGIFRERSKWMILTKNVLFIATICLPFLFAVYRSNPVFMVFLIIIYISYYSLIFVETLRQITHRGEVTVSVILGSFCGYLLLIMVCLFTLILIEFNAPKSFHGISSTHPELIYNELSYFSFIVFTSIGFGDIYPITDTARLATAFFGVVGQFYMVVLVGIIISKYVGVIDQPAE